MAYVMTASKFAEIAKDIATKYKTLYVMGCFGAPMTSSNKKRYTTNCAYNKKPERTAMINAASADTFGFDCVCLIKGILWGWSGNKNAVYGGAKYGSNGVPDVDADQIMNYCTDVSTDFSNLKVGEILHLSGHVGIYLGDGLAAECSPKWNNDVQITAVANIGKKSGYNARTWKNHGKLKFIDYATSSAPVQQPVAQPETPSVDPLASFTDEQLANKVIRGDFGNGEARKKALGSRYDAVQKIVDQMVNPQLQPVYYTVVKGDTLWAIAKRNATTVQDILKLNPNIKNANMINIGQKIRIK